MSGGKAAAPEKLHSRFGGSVAPRYLNCPGSVQAVALLPPEPPSKHALDGTMVHAIAAFYLKTGDHRAEEGWMPLGALENEGVDTTDLPAQGFDVTEEMAATVQVYLDAVYAELDEDPANELYVEHSFAITAPSADDGEVHGSNDALVYQPSRKRLIVFDLKNGVGVSVQAEENAQLKFYATGAAFDKAWPLNEVELVIVQPRAHDVDSEGAIRRWTFDTADLIDFAGELDNVIAVAKGPNPPLVAGPWCKKTFCPNKLCPAREQQALADIAADFADVKGVDEIVPALLPKVEAIDSARIPHILRGIETLNEWALQLNEYLRSELLAGRAVPGYKLVEKVGRRKWIESEDEIATYLSLMYDIDDEHLRPRKLVTITEVERLLRAACTSPAELKEAKMEMSLRFTVKESSGLSVVPETDRRPAVDAGADFASVNLDSLMKE